MTSMDEQRADIKVQTFKTDDTPGTKDNFKTNHINEIGDYEQQVDGEHSFESKVPETLHER